ncbi:MAG: hypothetical protein ACHQAY_02830 [Hyphomicrobiales bacterium]
MKTRIIEELGQADILLPALVGEGLAANDRVKLRMSALQAMAAHAQDPGKPPVDLSRECAAAGLDTAVIRSLIGEASLAGRDAVSAPGLESLRKGIGDDVTAMLRAAAKGDEAEGKRAFARWKAIKEEGLSGIGNEMPLAQVAKLTAISEGEGDSLHKLVMDLHKALNRLAASCAEEVVAGAHVFGLQPGDHRTVEAFMRGIDATRALKFDHPGLETMATRSGSRLVIQNDIGATDAHVVVITVEVRQVTITYTDVHLPRAKFFTGLFRKFPVEWSGLDRQKAEGLGNQGVFYLVTGRYQAENDEARDGFVEAIGTCLVFLIDWNKARKVLRAWIPKGDAVRILDWAARQRIGHRGFLELGGGDLVVSAVRHAAPSRIGFGERLDTALGREAAVDFLKAVLRISTEALLEGRSIRLARDRIEADLVRHLERADSMLLTIVVRQAGLAHDMAGAIAHHIAALQSGRQVDGRLLATRARRLEEKADKIAAEARTEMTRLDAGRRIQPLSDLIEDTIDDLEQAAFISSLLSAGTGAETLQPLSELAGVVIAAVQAAASGVDAAMDVPDGERSDSEDALAAVGRLIDAEHMADACERAVTSKVLGGDLELKASLAVLELARAMENATDRLAGFGHLLRERVLADLSS